MLIPSGLPLLAGLRALPVVLRGTSACGVCMGHLFIPRSGS